MQYSKDALRKMGQDAAESFLSKETPLNDSIAKTASTKDLNREQVARVCTYANHTVNASLLDKQAYTTFELADTEAIMPDKAAGFLVVPDPQEIQVWDFSVKEASKGGGGGAPSILDDFQAMAAAYGLNFEPLGDRQGDIKEAIKVAYLLSDAAEKNFDKSAFQAGQSGEDLYSKVREALLAGIPLEQIMQDAQQHNFVRELEQIWPRLEADFLVPASSYDDDGPHSMQRAYKMADFGQPAKVIESKMATPAKATGGTWAQPLNSQPTRKFTGAQFALKVAGKVMEGIEWSMDENAPLVKAARRLQDANEQMAIDAGAAFLADGVASTFADEYTNLAPSYGRMAKSASVKAMAILDKLAAPLIPLDRLVWKGLKGGVKATARVGLGTAKGGLKAAKGAGRFAMKHPWAGFGAAFAIPEAVGGVKAVTRAATPVPF